jgi:hypothetical protein
LVTRDTAPIRSRSRPARRRSPVPLKRILKYLPSYLPPLKLLAGCPVELSCIPRVLVGEPGAKTISGQRFQRALRKYSRTWHNARPTKIGWHCVKSFLLRVTEPVSSTFGAGRGGIREQREYLMMSGQPAYIAPLLLLALLPVKNALAAT